MKKKLFIVASIVILAFIIILAIKFIAPKIDSQIPYYYKNYTSIEAAMEAMADYRRAKNDSSYDINPPYSVKHTLTYEDNTLVFYSYCSDMDGEIEEDELYVDILKHNKKGTYNFEGSGGRFLVYEEPNISNYYCYAPIKTKEGNGNICFIYLPMDSNKTVYFDGVKAEKIKVNDGENEYYICYAVSYKKISFIKKLFTDISDRHTIVFE